MGEQTQTLAAGAITVQIAGDDNTVTIIRAGAQLSLNRLHTRKATPTIPIELLRTDIRATTLVGREVQLQQLADWRATPQRIAVCSTGRQKRMNRSPPNCSRCWIPTSRSVA
jgi:hypothetical protein